MLTEALPRYVYLVDALLANTTSTDPVHFLVPACQDRHLFVDLLTPAQVASIPRLELRDEQS